MVAIHFILVYDSLDTIIRILHTRISSKRVMNYEFNFFIVIYRTLLDLIAKTEIVISTVVQLHDCIKTFKKLNEIIFLNTHSI